jgi:DNA modification methylase
MARKGNPKIQPEGHSNVFELSPPSDRFRWHPTQHPVNLIEEIFSTFGKPNSLIMSPFLGSGTTWIAAQKQKMHCIGWDLSEDYRNAFLAEITKGDLLGQSQG